MWHIIRIKRYGASCQLAMLATSWVQSLWVRHASVRHRRMTFWPPSWMMEMTTNSVRPAAVWCSGWRWWGRSSTRTSSRRTVSAGCLLCHLGRQRTETPISASSTVRVLKRGSWSCCTEADGCVFTYRGHEDYEFDPSDVACDSNEKNHRFRLDSNRSLHMLSPGRYIPKISAVRHVWLIQLVMALISGQYVGWVFEWSSESVQIQLL